MSAICKKEFKMNPNRIFVISIIMFVLSVGIFLTAAIPAFSEECRFSDDLVIPDCHVGNIFVNTCDDLEQMKSVKIIYGSVFIKGIYSLCNKNFTGFNFGNLQWISGVLYINHNPILRAINVTNLRHATFITIVDNPFLIPCSAVTIGETVRCGDGKSCKEAGKFEEYLNAGECIRDEDTANDTEN